MQAALARLPVSAMQGTIRSPTITAACWSPSQQWRDTERQIPRGIQTPAFMEVVHGVGASITTSSSPSATKCHLSLCICWPGSKHKVLVSCTFLIAPSLKQPLKASQHGKEEEEPNQWAVRPQLWAPESSFPEQSEAQGCTDGSSDTGGSQWMGLGSSGLTALVLHVEVSCHEGLVVSRAGRRTWRNQETPVKSLLVLLGKTLSCLSTAMKAFLLNRETGTCKKPPPILILLS